MAELRLTPYGGAGEIGGNAFLVEDGASRLMLDFGKRFGIGSVKSEVQRTPGFGDYYDLLMRPRSGHQVHDLLALGLLPDLRAPGVYRTDLGGPHAPTDQPGLDLVLVSHPHADHYGMMGYLHPGTRFGMSPLARLTLQSVQQTSGTKGPDDSFVRFKSEESGDLRTGPGRSDDEVLATLPARHIDAADRFEVGAWEVTRHAVDHSIHGASAFILTHRDGPTIAYSGDLRLHGRDPDATRRFLEAARGADIVMVEGTRVRAGAGAHGHGAAHGEGPGQVPSPQGGTVDRPVTEHDVERQVREALTGKALASGTGFAAVAYPPRDLDRLVSVLRAAAHAGRKLVVTDRQAHLLWLLHHHGHVNELSDPLQNPALRILVDEADLAKRAHELASGKAGAVRKGETAWSLWTRDVKLLWNRILDSDRTVTVPQVKAAPREYLVTMSTFTLNLLPGLLEPGRPDNGLFIHSQTQPFNDEGLLRDAKLRRWLDAFGLAETDTHVSGHIAQDALFHALDEWTNKTLVPIHTEHPHLTQDQFMARSGQRVLLPRTGQTLRL